MRTFFLSIMVLTTAIATYAASNVAYKDNQVRFTVISDGTVRMEYAPDGNFVDNSSFVAVDRDYPEANYTVKDGKWIEIKTPRMELRYKKGSGKFTPANLSVKGRGNLSGITWVPGKEQKENLKGTYRTLDRCNGGILHEKGKEPVAIPIEDGLLARDGWTLIDDSGNFLFDGAEDWDWVKERNAHPDAQDWYFMLYGNDYKRALQDYALFAGKMPLPPRYAFGYWWSRYWAYSDQEYRNLLDRMDSYRIPLDVLVVDMDWHYTDGERGAWTGFSWNKSLFPNPDKFLNYLRDRNLKITLNLHPASGIKSFETAYPAIAADMGMDPAAKKDIPWYGSNKTFMKSLFSNVFNPMEKQGVSFWWLDWQQYPNDLLIKNLSNTWWINYVFFSQMDKFTDRRPILYHRWGGLGNHRYQIGFSGDSYITWESLDYQPYFNSTASNVLYGFWSHDIGGHMIPGKDITGKEAPENIDPEMYVRWMQFGALSPILRTHSTKDKRIEKEPWVFDPEVLEIIRDVVRQRYRMAPYIYTIARQAHDSSVSMCRPMYYDYPEAEEAYSFRNQYMFGDQMLVAPITSPADGVYSTVDVWLPEGKWYEVASGTLLDGGKTVTRRFALDEYPLYVKAGAVIPYTARDVQNLGDNDNPIAVYVFPGGDGSFTLYEDGGDNKDYETAYATTDLTAETEGNTLKVKIAPRKGSYAGMPSHRDYSVRILCSDIPEEVTINGEKANFEYDAKEFAVVVDLAGKDCSKASEIEIRYAPERRDLATGLIGRTRRVAKTIAEYKTKRNPGRVFDDDLGDFGSIVVAVNYDPAQLHQLVDHFEDIYSRLPQVLQQFGSSEKDSADRQWILTQIDY